MLRDPVGGRIPADGRIKRWFLDDEGKLGRGFTSADALEEVDIGDGDRPRLTFISARLDPEYKQELVELLKEYKDYFAL